MLCLVMVLSVCTVININGNRVDILKILFSLSNIQIEEMIKSSQRFLRLHENGFEVTGEGESEASQSEVVNGKELALSLSNRLTGKLNMESKRFKGVVKKFIVRVFVYFVLLSLVEFLFLFNYFRDLSWISKVKNCLLYTSDAADE
eukprot:TRINITY_DN4570_c0_g1_i1.p1 TRINITY_DN4570_c0_g1~~TRINITY_DN4570_c0_g1_i1.p1  ORF type:complete len:146 (-),score=43.54 TRINITY_DN4570_c0_g1_i1:49-486(-)